MNVKNEKLKKVILFLQIFSIIYWFTFLLYSNSYYMPYLIVGIGGCISLYKNVADHKVYYRSKEQFLILIFSFLYALIIVAANYAMFLNLPYPEESGILFHMFYSGFTVICTFAGGFFVFWNLLNYLLDKLGNFYWIKVEYQYSPKLICILSWILITCINMFLMLMCKYPGNVSLDSMNCIHQSLTGEYNNHQPFYFTVFVKFFQVIGLKITDDINFSTVLFSGFQIIFMAGCFSFIIVTLYQMKLSLKLILCCQIWLTFMPYHIMYSFTMWKDVMFGGVVSLFIVSAFRVLNNIGNNRALNYLFLIIGSVGMCLLRSNGWFAYLLTICGFIFLFGKSKKKLCIIFIMVAGVTFLLKHPVLNYLNVRQPDIIEALSIPIQQIARVITDCGDIKMKEEQRELLNKIVDVEAVPDVYNASCSDSEKGLFRTTGNPDYLIEHKMEYIKLYLEIGISYPHKYLEAWIDQTKGYWNGGHQGGTWSDVVVENEYGVERIVYSEKINKMFNDYLWLFHNERVLSIFVCIGFHVWILMGLGLINIVRKNKEGIFMLFPVGFIIISLLISTPLDSEFRYIYALFCCLPFLIFSAFYHKNCIVKNGSFD